MNKKIIWLILLLGVVLISGCIGESVTKGRIGNSTFEVDGEWDETEYLGDVARYSQGSQGLEFIISQFDNKEDYEELGFEGLEAFNPTNYTISGVSVQRFVYYNSLPEINDKKQPQYIYFFEKNGGYYEIVIYDRFAFDYTAPPEAHEERTTEPVNRIISTIK